MHCALVNYLPWTGIWTQANGGFVNAQSALSVLLTSSEQPAGISFKLFDTQINVKMTQQSLCFIAGTWLTSQKWNTQGHWQNHCSSQTTDQQSMETALEVDIGKVNKKVTVILTINQLVSSYLNLQH